MDMSAGQVHAVDSSAVGHEQRGTSRALLAVLLAPLFMYQADATIVNVANPSIQSDLRASGAELELVVGGYLIASATLLITGARLGQMRGYRRTLLAGVGVFTLASLACGLAPSPLALIAGRVLQGAGGALMYPQILSAIQVNFTQESERTRALGLYAIALAGGAVAGQILGGLLVSADLFGAQWRPIFLINVPIGAAVVLAGLRWLPADDELGARGRLDLPGAAALSGALLLIVLPLSLGRQEGWPPWTFLCLAASVPLLGAFVVLERRLGARAGSPLLNLDVLARPAIAWGLLPQPLLISTYYALLFTLALYLQHGLGFSPLASGLTLVSWVAAFGFAGRLLGRLPARRGRLVPAAGCLILGLAYLALSATAFAGRPPVAVLVALLGIGGFGLGTTFGSILKHLTSAATPRYAADISGVFTTSLQVAGAIGVAAFGTAYLGLATEPGSGAATDAFAIITAAFALIAFVAAAGAYRATHVRAQPGAIPET